MFQEDNNTKTNSVGKRTAGLETSFISSRACCVINADYDVTLSLCSFSRNEQVVRFLREEKSSVVSMKLVFPLTALTVFLFSSYLTYPAKREGKICSRFKTSFSFSSHCKLLNPGT